jgi:hypothetical protein
MLNQRRRRHHGRGSLARRSADCRWYFLSRPYEERPHRRHRSSVCNRPSAASQIGAARQVVTKCRRLEQGLLNAGWYQATTTKGIESRVVASDSGDRCGVILTSRGASSGKTDDIDGERVLAHRLPVGLAPCTLPIERRPGSNRFFQLLRRPERDLFAGGDLHHLACGRIASSARLALANL